MSVAYWACICFFASLIIVIYLKLSLTFTWKLSKVKYFEIVYLNNFHLFQKFFSLYVLTKIKVTIKYTSMDAEKNC